jgi:chromosome segregation ATPase
VSRFYCGGKHKHAGLRRYLKQILATLNNLETSMSELDASVDALRASVADLATRIDPAPLNEALANVQRLTDELAAAHADDATDQAEIDRLNGELTDAITDAQENVTRITEVTGQISALGQPPEA